MNTNTSLQINRVEIKRPDFSLHVDKLLLNTGDVLGVVGTNGSGKTSFIESLLRVSTTDSYTDVEIHADDHLINVARASDRLQFGSQIQNTSFPDDIKVRDIVTLHALLYGDQDSDLFSILRIDDLEKKVFVKCSLGEQRRVELYFCCAHNPRFVFLDEPTSSLDDHYSNAFVKALNSLATKGSIILLCTHSSKEIQLCSKLLWLDDGKCQFRGAKTQFRENYLGLYKLKRENGGFPLYSTALRDASLHHLCLDEYTTYFGNSQLKNLVMDLNSSSCSGTGMTVSHTNDQDILRYTSRTKCV